MSTNSAQYAKPGQQRLAFAGMCTVCAPDAQPPGKVPLAINVHAYLEDAITPRLPQSAPLVTLVPSAAVHSLRRMNDNTGVLNKVASGPNPVTVGADVPVTGATAWSNPGNITGEDASYASVTLTSPGSGQTSGPNGPTSAFQSVLGSGNNFVSWSNPSNVLAQDGATATATYPGGGTNSYGLFVEGFNFNIPSGAIITGIQVDVRKSCSNAQASDLIVMLLRSGSATGNNKATSAIWPSVLSFVSYGGPSDLWGTTFTPADVNGSGFGVLLQAKVGTVAGQSCSIDYVRITITYSTSSTVVNSDYLQGTGFGFAIPGGATIAGILVEIKGFANIPFPGVGGIDVQLLKAGVLAGTFTPLSSLPLTNGFKALGGNSSLWGTTWTAADINDPNFGVSLQAFCSYQGAFNIDYVRITVYYYVGSPATGYVLISGAADKLYVGSTQVDSGYSQSRLAMTPFRPDTSVQPWMYIGDSAKMSKVRSDGTVYKQGIQEPQTIPGQATAGAGVLTGQYYYAYKYRSSATGAQSNPSPTLANLGVACTANAVTVTCASSADPQVDLIDIYRLGGGLLSYTYIATIQNSSPTYTDNVITDADADNNPVMTFDDYEPFPSIDTPKNGTLVVSAGPLPDTITCTWASGDNFNTRWLGGTLVTLSTGSGSTLVALFARPNSTTVFVGVPIPLGAAVAAATYTFAIEEPNLAAQPLPALWGPTDGAAYMFACGDPLRPGTLYFTKGNNPDSAPQSNQIEITSPTEPLIGGVIVGGVGIVMSTERGWILYPNFAQATATVIGVAGQPFQPVESISERGLWCKEGICTDGGGMMFFIAKDGIRQSMAGSGSESITDDIDNLFPHEGLTQKPYTIAGFTVSPPDYTQPNGMCLRFSQGYVYFDYLGLDGTYHTLKYQVRKKAWSVEVYSAVASVHADNEGQGTTGSPPLPSIGPLTGCADSTIRNLSTTATESGARMTVLTPSVGAGSMRANKHFGDLYLETSFPAAGTPQFTLSLWTNRYSVQLTSALSPATIPIPATIRDGQIVELNAGQGVYSQDVALQITGPVIAPGLSSDGTNQVYAAFYLWEPTLIEQPETIGQRVSDWDDAGYPGAKFVQGVIIEADTGGVAKSFRIQSGDDQSFNSLAEIVNSPLSGAVFVNQSKQAFSLAQPFIAHNMRIVPGDNVPWRLFSVQYIYTPIPESCLEWHTESTAHGIPGWQFIKEIHLEHISTSDITLTLIADTGAQVQITIPNSNGLQAKTLVSAPVVWQNSTGASVAPKFQLVSYNFTSSSPFRLWKEDVEVKIGQWGRSSEYQIVKPFGGQSASQEAQV